jgi:hypothetical protein
MELAPQLWNWYAVFFYTMGAVLSLAGGLVFAVLACHWLYLCAKNIESQPTPAALIPAILKLSAFQALILGAVMVPLGLIVIYYLSSALIWKLAPTPVEAPPLDFGSGSFEAQIASMATLLLNLFALAGLIAGAIFGLCRYWARRLKPSEGSWGFPQRFVWAYFHESVGVGVALMLIACPVIWYFLYNMALLLMVVFPAVRHELPRIALPQAEQFYIRGVELVGGGLIVILFLPAVGLLLRGMLLRWRYTFENQFLRLILIRTLKFSVIGCCCWLGGLAMYYLADTILQGLARVSF